jgi:hypothetical protein
MVSCTSVVLLVCFVCVSVAEEPKKDPKDAGRDLRKMFLTTAAEKVGIQPSQEYPRVWGVAMDWPIGEHIATVISLCDGSASVYTTGTFGIIGGVGHETVRSAAKKLMKEAECYYDAARPTQDFSYPPLDHVRFFLVTFDGVRVIESDVESLTERRSKYSRLFDLAQDVIARLRIVSEPASK